MANKNIAKYLHDIAHKKAINFHAFLKCLPENLANDVKNNVTIDIVKGNQSLVSISCELINEQLKKLSIDVTNRIEASKQGNSHRVNTSTSYFFIYHEQSHVIHPDSVVITHVKANYTFKPKNHALIIENSELFFARQYLFDKMNDIFNLNLSFKNTDIIYGSGNQITNKLNESFFKNYKNVLCFFDYDLGGLKIFKGMKNMLGDKVHFLEPPLVVFDDYFVKKPKNMNQYNKALINAQDLGLMRLYSLLLSQRAFMEQEVILAFK